MKTTKLILSFCMMYFIWGESTANNIQIGVPSVSGSDLTFTVQWDNSWKTTSAPNNWDAVWIFIKYQECTGTQEWNHAGLSTTSGDHSVTGGVLQVDAVADGKGVYVRRIADGSGNIASATVTVQMDFADASYNYQVFGMEMVYIPTESYWLGDGSSSYRLGLNTGVPLQITSNDPPLVYDISGCGSTTNISAAYPEGYDSIYCMKYEITQEQYVGFLNSLTYAQQVNRTSSTPSSLPETPALTGTNRNGIKTEISGVPGGAPAVYMNDLTAGTYNSTDDGQNIALNWIMWDDLRAYLDWAALRPMSELEFEKICRGPVLFVNNHYPWGSTVISQAASNSLTNPQQADEVSTSTGDGLCAYSNATGGNFGPGPLRVGFAAAAATTRTQAGASFYGVMEMGGNMWEQTIRYDNTTFTKATGDGVLTVAGDADVAGWPTYAWTIGRGGGYAYAALYSMISYRYNTGCAIRYQFRNAYAGGRGVRAN